MLILVQKGPKCFINFPWAKNGRDLKRDISPLTEILMLIFEWKMSKG